MSLLNPLGVNCLRALPSGAVVVWGARTLAGADENASEWRYVPVRRLALFIEESIIQGTQWAVFEPDVALGNEPLWQKLRQAAGNFMMSLWRAGALQGATPDQAFFVRCDAGTTTEDDRARGIVTILLGFAPLRPAEFVILRIELSTTAA